MYKNNSLEYTCLFGGGAIRGAAHVGAIKAFDELGITSNTLGGSSVGSIIASLKAVGYSAEELRDIFLSVNFELFRDISFGFNTNFALSKGEVFLDWFRELIEKKFYGDEYDKGNNKPVKFKDIDKNLIIISTNMKDFSGYEFSTFVTPDFEIAMAVRISCCAPGLMKAVSIDDKLLVDGDLMKGKPMWSLFECLKNSKNRILEIRLEGEYSGEDSKPIDYVNGIYSCMTSCGTDFIKNLYEYNDMRDFLVLNTGSVVVFDFNYPHEKRQQIIDSGYIQTMEYFTKFLPHKKHKLLGIYNEILNKIYKVQKFMIRKKYMSAKNSLGDLYILLIHTKDYIDENIFNEIDKLQKFLYSNIKNGLLGITTCENTNLINAQLNLIIDYLSQKINEINTYINLNS